jgi:hypothetical protein
MQQMEQVTAFRAGDGALFDKIEQCQTYEVFSEKFKSEINMFLHSSYNRYPETANTSRYSKVIIGWELFKIGIEVKNQQY